MTKFDNTVIICTEEKFVNIKGVLIIMRRQKGEGSYGKKKISGKEYFYYKSPSGKWTYGKTLNELRTKIKTAESNQIVIKSKQTIQEYALNWVNTTKKNKIKPQTLEGYITLIQSWNLPKYSFGNILISEITDDKVQLFIDSLVQQEYSLGTIRKQWTILKQCLKYGMSKGEINKFDLSLIVPPTEEGVIKKRKTVGFVTASELNQIYEESLKKSDIGFGGSEYFYGNNARIIIFIGYTGLRVSEATALKWKDVNLDKKVINVSATHTILKNQGVVLSTPKRYKARTVPLSDRALEQIMFFDAFNPGHRPDDYVFLNRNKTFIKRRNISTTFDRICKNCNLKNLTLHSLRHGFGSILLDKGVEIKIISELLGHSDIRTTYNIYIGVTDKQKADAISVLNDV